MTAILLNVLAPILLMVFLGAAMRWKFRIDLSTLTKLNIYLFMPAFVFDKVSRSTLQWSEMGGIVGVTALQVATLGLSIWLGGRLVGASRQTLSAVAMAVMFYNSGNYGIPLAELAYAGRGGQVQTFVVMTQNILTWTVGMSIAAFAHHGSWGKGVIAFLRTPVLPTLAAALVARAYLNGQPDRHLPRMIAETARYLSDGLVPLALVTLGAQLATSPRWPRWKPVSVVIVLRLLLGPAQMAALLYGLHLMARNFGGVWTTMDLWPWPAELLILTAAVPTAVNTLLMTLELGGDSDLAADCVFWTTVVSGATIALWLWVIRGWFG